MCRWGASARSSPWKPRGWARSNLEWHWLIEICALTRTLVIDEDGCYDPADFNDALLLGLKATIAQAELRLEPVGGGGDLPLGRTQRSDPTSGQSAGRTRR